MAELNIGSLNSAMAGYNPPQASQAPSSSGGLGGILDTILQLGGMVGGEAIGGPAGAAIGSGLGTGAGELLSGHGLNAGQIGQGALYGLMPGMIGGKAAGAAADVADSAVKDTAPSLIGDLTSATEGSTAATEPKFIVDPSGNVTSTDNPGVAPTAIDPATGQGHVNLTTNPETGGVKADTANTFTPPAAPAETPPTTQTPSTVTPTATPPETSAPQTSPTDTFTQAPVSEGSNLNTLQKIGNTVSQNALEAQIGNAGSHLSQAEKAALGAKLNADGYPNLSKAAQDANPVVNILNNGINDHINNAEANGASINLGNYNDLAHQHINNTLMSGVLTPAQEKAAANTLNSVRNIVAGPGAADPTETAALTKVLPSNNLQAVRALGKQAKAQFDIAQGHGASAEGASQLGHLYTNFGHTLMDKGFGVGNGASPVSDANLQNMIDQVKGANFNNSDYQQNLLNSLESGKGGNLSLQNLRSLMANHVGYSQAANPDEISNLTNGLMSAGLNKTGITNAVLNSDPGLTVKAKAGQLLKKMATPGGSGAGTTNTTSGGRTMSPIGKGAAIAGVLAALGLTGNAVATHNQSSQANAELNSPQYQQTQALLNNSNQLQRYLGQMGEIRSVFAPTFDTNAGQAGTTGQTLLASANQNAAANTAANNLLTARAHMGLGGILGGIAGLIPGTPENTYKNQAANAQAQLNSLGIAGNAPAVSQGGGSIPALTSMAGNVGAF